MRCADLEKSYTVCRIMTTDGQVTELAYGVRLESESALKSTEGSNPSLSAHEKR